MKEEYFMGYEVTLEVHSQEECYVMEDRLKDYTRSLAEDDENKDLRIGYFKCLNHEAWHVHMYYIDALPIHVGYSYLDAVIKLKEVKKKLDSVIQKITEGIEIMEV